jgi:pyridoxal phosphate enzyme (YggS family)
MTIADNLANVRSRMEAACRRCRRNPATVTLVAVSKKQENGAIEQAYAAGQRDFGENYAQELRDKAKSLAHLKDLRWHAIGTLQTNKARYVAPVATLFHALDDLDVAKELGRRATAAGRSLPCLIEVNGGEETKSGVGFDEIPTLLSDAKTISGVEIRGLMIMPPASDEPEASRPLFSRLRESARQLGLSDLSMGMTQDFEVAIEEGATLIRVGTAIFGPR